MEENVGVKDCCKQDDNLEVQTSDGRTELVVRKCRVCGCKHFELTLNPGVIGLLGKSL